MCRKFSQPETKYKGPLFRNLEESIIGKISIYPTTVIKRLSQCNVSKTKLVPGYPYIDIEIKKSYIDRRKLDIEKLERN